MVLCIHMQAEDSGNLGPDGEQVGVGSLHSGKEGK